MRLRLFAVAAALLSFAGCDCGPKTRTVFPVFELPKGDGTVDQRTALDFGQVQNGVKSTRKISVRNGGTSALTVDSASVPAPFSFDTALPLTLEPGAESTLTIGFSPTVADRRETATLTLTSNDPDKPTASIALSGTGIAAVGRVSPNPVDFGDVYAAEMKTVVVQVFNLGSGDMVVKDAVLSGVPATVTGDLAPLKQTLGPNTSAMASLKYAPTTTETFSGTLTVTIEATPNITLTVPVKGRGIQSRPQLCLRNDADGGIICAEVTNPFPQVALGGFCDQRVYGTDGGALACAPDSGFTGKLFLRNLGNVPYAYTMRYDLLPGAAARCDGGSLGSDWTFSNQPPVTDGGAGLATRWTEPTVKLPTMETEPMPWESAPISVSYRARSMCREDSADQAFIFWTRQPDSATAPPRPPGSLTLTLNATSRLPRAVDFKWSCGTSASPATVPCSTTFFGVANEGTAPLRVTKVELWEEFSPDAGAGTGPNGGIFQQCVPGNPASPCEVFAWTTDGGDPNLRTPITVNPTPPGSLPTTALGQLTFGPAGRGCFDAGAACPNSPYRIYAVVSTDDPYGQNVLVQISGYAQ